MEKFLEKVANAVFFVRDALGERWSAHSNKRTFLILCFAIVIGGHIYLAYVRPPESFPIGTLIEVPAGVSLTESAQKLSAAGVVRSSAALKILLRLWGKDDQVHAGDYLFKQPKNLFEVARILSVGAFGLEPEKIRVHEGATVREMAVIFDRQLLRFDPEVFIAEALPYEGFLFPDTYFFLPNASEKTVVQTLRQTFDSMTEDMQRKAASSTRSFNDIVIMASLIEREATNRADRRMISGLLWNRLDLGMLLQVDAAFRYTNGKGTFDLTLADLAEDSPYNTYKYKGLPPTPIGSPSLDSLDAALNPTKNNFIFYLADFNGVTHFTRTYAEHLELKRKYLDSQR